LALISSIEPMPRKPIELPPGFARSFVDDMRAYFAETNLIKRDEIAHTSSMLSPSTTRPGYALPT